MKNCFCFLIFYFIDFHFHVNFFISFFLLFIFASFLKLTDYQSNAVYCFQKEELGRLLINIFAVVPGGVVCFFSSYDYEDKVYKYWQASGILDKMNARKKVTHGS